MWHAIWAVTWSSETLYLLKTLYVKNIEFQNAFKIKPKRGARTLFSGDLNFREKTDGFKFNKKIICNLKHF